MPGKVPGGQLMRDAWAQARAEALELAKERKLRRDPSRVAARERSKRAFVGLGGAEAARLAEQQFPEIVSEPSVGPLARGQVADEYVGRFAARLKGAAPGGKDALVMSGSPLRDRDASGELAPVDISLQRDGGAFAAVNPVEDYTIGDGGEIAFEEGLTVDPAGTSGGGELVGETVFFANTQTDTDTLVKPRTDGVQVAWQLRSAASPQELPLDVALPEGASLGQAGPDGVTITDGAQPIARISPAIAYDADGVPVDAKLRVDGDRVVVDVDHQGKDLAYPIMVDPEVVGVFDFQFDNQFGFWATYNQPGTKMTLLPGNHWYGRGLYIQSNNYPQEPTPQEMLSNGGPGLADRAGYYFHAPGNAKIYKVLNGHSRHILGASLHTCVVSGITNANLNGWEGPNGYTWGEGCAPYGSYPWNVSVPAGGGSTGNAFLFGVYTYSNNRTAFNSVLHNAHIYMIDNDAPYGPNGFAGPLVMVPKTFPDWNQNPEDHISATARDTSTGVKSITFYGPAGWTHNGMNGQSGITITNPNCGYGPCSRASGYPYQEWTASLPIGNMPDGEHVITAVARDAAGNASPTSSPYTMRFDLVPPPTPQGVRSAGFDGQSSTAVLAIEPGREDPDGADRDQVSPLSVINYRWRRPGGAFGVWATLPEDFTFLVPNAQLGEAIEVEARSVDTAGHVSATMIASATVQPTPQPGDLAEIAAAPGVGNADVVVNVEPRVEGAAVDPVAGMRVTLRRDADGATVVDDTDETGAAVFPDMPAGAYRVAAVGIAGEPDLESPNTPVQAQTGSTTPVAVAADAESVCEKYQNLPGMGAYCDLNKQEKDWLRDKKHWLYGVRFLNAAAAAIKKTEEMFNGGNSAQLNGTKANAFQHSYWVALMVREAYNIPRYADFPHYAWEYAQAHESDDLVSPINAVREGAQMDDHNNYVGYMFADRREENRNSNSRLCFGMRSAVWGGKRGASGATSLQLYWLFAREEAGTGVRIVDPPAGPYPCA